MTTKLLIVIVSLICFAIVSADCGCGTKCSAYSNPSRCTRCCTATVKRSLRNGPDGNPLTFDSNSFLISSKSSYAYPKWTRRSNDRFLTKLSDILGLMAPPFL